MIALRMLSFLAGALVLVLPPVLLGNADAGGSPALMVAGCLLGLALMSACFIYTGLMGERMRHKGPERTLGSLLLAVPIASGLVLLASSKGEVQLWSSGVLLAVSLLLFLSFIYPGLDRRRRPMRRRERSEPALVLVQRHPSAERRARTREGSLGV